VMGTLRLPSPSAEGITLLQTYPMPDSIISEKGLPVNMLILVCLTALSDFLRFSNSLLSTRNTPLQGKVRKDRFQEDILCCYEDR